MIDALNSFYFHYVKILWSYLPKLCPNVSQFLRQFWTNPNLALFVEYSCFLFAKSRTELKRWKYWANFVSKYFQARFFEIVPDADMLSRAACQGLSWSPVGRNIRCKQKRLQLGSPLPYWKTATTLRATMPESNNNNNNNNDNKRKVASMSEDNNNNNNNRKGSYHARRQQ